MVDGKCIYAVLEAYKDEQKRLEACQCKGSRCAAIEELEDFIESAKSAAKTLTRRALYCNLYCLIHARAQELRKDRISKRRARGLKMRWTRGGSSWNRNGGNCILSH